MLKSRPELFFVNILLSIDKIKRNIKNVSYEEFITDETLFGFITRELQEIGESVKKLLKLYKFEDKTTADLQKIAAFRNVVAHKYFGAEPEIIFAVANDEIPIFENQILNLLEKIEDKAYLLQAIELTIPIYAKMKRDESVAYLNMVLEKLKKKNN